MMYNQHILSDTLTISPSTADVSSRILDELRELYYGHFDNHWFTTLLEDNSFDTGKMRYIRNMLEIQSIYSAEPVVFYDGIEILEEIILTAKRYILPELRDQLKISGFFKGRINQSREELVMKNLFSYTFPLNLERLEELTVSLRENLAL